MHRNISPRVEISKRSVRAQDKCSLRAKLLPEEPNRMEKDDSNSSRAVASSKSTRKAKGFNPKADSSKSVAKKTGDHAKGAAASRPKKARCFTVTNPKPISYETQRKGTKYPTESQASPRAKEKPPGSFKKNKTGHNTPQILQTIRGV